MVLPSGYLPFFSPPRTVTVPKRRSAVVTGALLARFADRTPCAHSDCTLTSSGARVKFVADRVQTRRYSAPRRGGHYMKAGWILSATAVVLLIAASASAFEKPFSSQLQPIEERESRPGSAALAAAANVLFVPIRVAVTTVGAGLGGLTGWLTAGNHHAADDIWG